jgi:hypothetical protein
VLASGIIHYNSYCHFRRPEAAENKPVAAENKQFSATISLFSAASGRQKKLAENKPLFSAARVWPPKIAYFRRLATWPPKITDYFRRLASQPPEITTAEITNFRAKKLKKNAKNNRISYKIHTITEIPYNHRKFILEFTT